VAKSALRIEGAMIAGGDMVAMDGFVVRLGGECCMYSCSWVESWIGCGAAGRCKVRDGKLEENKRGNPANVMDCPRSSPI
jgi:hypothetical protein